MPSFDVVSEVDMHEVTNAVDQANREVRARFDFKGTDSSYARDVDIACLTIGQPELAGKEARQVVTIRQGLETDLCRRLVKMIKESKLKVVVGEEAHATLFKIIGTMALTC